jgi:hypothetical protein
MPVHELVDSRTERAILLRSPLPQELDELPNGCLFLRRQTVNDGG